jgi:hypothetical protein
MRDRCLRPNVKREESGGEPAANNPRGAFYLACMAVGVVLMLLFYFWSGQVWALCVWLWT